LVGKPERKRSLGRAGTKQGADIKMDREENELGVREADLFYS
jgi:hypothetical protein